ncbi:NAD(P)/FAD-dependent oxidoreductase [Sulfitobacter sp. SK011]|uniref:phytoene desaturase family protein n=1 Tax=Sulfitobacter sp. SK011 TaxID=1389004 RepID=UPI000E0A6792|nr:NAD(P)/FAD-dependent oxidoreductase [Sulfitobacter sp. SK011]AXI42652.1 NAD(P)/FAD-dependent oxidoreductase [Sulfitobacter sp. SK011]
MVKGETQTWDAIVIGSGMGGMASAATLSKMGHKVLLLEQYETLGGLTHSFSRDGFSWDVGIHYLGCVAPGDRERGFIDWLAHTPMDFEPMGAVYDNLHLADAPPLALSRPFEAQERDFKDRFPDEAEAIEAWIAALREGRDAMYTLSSTRGMPEIAAQMTEWWNHRAINKWCRRTTQEVVDSITQNPELAAAFTAQWGDHGGRPHKASFGMHAQICGSYLESGAWYPVGGGKAFADHLIPTITHAGGEARAGVKVETLLVEDDKVVGVRTSTGEDIRSDVVISDIGARETINNLLPSGFGPEDWISEIQALPASIAHFDLFLGFEGDVEQAGATRSNHWVYPTGQVDAVWAEAPEGDPPGFFLSFGSLKDPSHDPGPKQKYAGDMVVWTDWDCVAQWADMPSGARGAQYKAFKQQVEDKMFALLERYFPDLADLVVFRELSTPLATAAITGHHQGRFYGLDGTPERALSRALKAKTPIEGLYLSGQDVVSQGIQGALWGGVLAAASVDPRVFRQLRG